MLFRSRLGLLAGAGQQGLALAQEAAQHGVDEFGRRRGALAWCKDNMAAYKYPRVVQFVDALPKSGSGKVMWRALQEAESERT